MKSKIFSKRVWLIIILSIITFLLLIIAGFIFNGLHKTNPILSVENTTDTAKQEQIIYGFPVRLKIPAINVDAVIEYVGIIANGEMGVPKDRANVAWFELGPHPGENGSAVIAGHYGTWLSGGSSVFDDLNKLLKGDKLYIEDDKGMIISFVVREIKSYDSKADATNVFSSYDGKAHLSLITCEGVWSETSKSYPNRLVVFTDRY